MARAVRGCSVERQASDASPWGHDGGVLRRMPRERPTRGVCLEPSFDPRPPDGLLRPGVPRAGGRRGTPVTRAVPRRIFGLWTGPNAMPERRRSCWATFGVTGLDPVLVTPANLAEWVVPHWPLHPAYELLSPTHRADYLRAYLMHHHGGGYADIKRQLRSWIPTVEKVVRSRWLIGAGYAEIRGGPPRLHLNAVDGRCRLVAVPVPRVMARIATDMMRAAFPLMIGNCAFFLKPRTAYTRCWLTEVEQRLDALLPALRRHPGAAPRGRAGDGSGYPVPWTFLLGDITSPLSLALAPWFCRRLPRPSFDDYL